MTDTMVGRPQPQTTREDAGGPFVRHTQPGNLPQYVQPNVPFGNLIQNPLVARPGYFRNFRLLFEATGGVNGTTTVAVTADSLYALASQISFKDPFGTLIFSLPSYEARLVHIFSGGAGCGLGGQADPANLPSFSAVSTGTSGTGNFQWALTLPLEFTKGIGTIPGANASVQPNLSIQLNPASSVYSTSPVTVPTVTLDVETQFYWLPDQSIAPPALGTSRQWILQQANPPITSGGNQRAAFPRLGGYLDTLILELRDANNARVGAFPSSLNRFVLYIDGVAIEDAPMWELLDDEAIKFEGLSVPTGVFCYTRKDSLSQRSMGLLDTGEATLSSNPGTLLESQGQPWGTIGSPPALLNVIVGQIIPRGRLPQGLPEV